MEIFLKIILSFFAYGLISVATALAISAPIDKRKNEKLVELKQQAIFFGVIAVVFYLIWSY